MGASGSTGDRGEEVERFGKRRHRQELIAKAVGDRGEATATELAKEFGVSMVTIHRDLEDLGRAGIVRRLRGRVSQLPSTVFESNLSFRERSAVAEKRAIARKAVSLVEPGMSVMFDDSSTGREVAKLLVGRGPLTVVTNFLEVMNIFASDPDVKLLGLTGEYDLRFRSFLGQRCIDMVESTRADVSFVSASGVYHTEVNHQIEKVGAVKTAMVSRSIRKYLLMDHTKFGRPGLYRIAELNDFSAVVTDWDISCTELEVMRGVGVEVYVGTPVEG